MPLDTAAVLDPVGLGQTKGILEPQHDVVVGAVPHVLRHWGEGRRLGAADRDMRGRRRATANPTR